MPKHALIAILTLLLVAAGGSVAVAASEPDLAAHGPTAVTGTDATAVFQLGDRTVRQVRYHDQLTLTYSFALSNDSRLPVTVAGLAPLAQEPRLFRYTGITDADGDPEFSIPAGKRRVVRISMLMHSCETLSARAGSFATEANLATSRAGVLDSVVAVTFPEEVHTGSPREAFCPNATATSRPPG
ncbi:MAG TPA: hypothetical protein VFD59_18555 [Nocardioidaceae bacterium]|nr:hypothetical protein [Nocardioidaceae bacterium]